MNEDHKTRTTISDRLEPLSFLSADSYQNDVRVLWPAVKCSKMKDKFVRSDFFSLQAPYDDTLRFNTPGMSIRIYLSFWDHLKCRRSSAMSRDLNNGLPEGIAEIYLANPYPSGKLELVPSERKK